jgi:protein-tyrosine-phosphatase
LRARQLQSADFDRFDFVLAMDRATSPSSTIAGAAAWRAWGCSWSTPETESWKSLIRTTAASRISSACWICMKRRREECWRVSK